MKKIVSLARKFSYGPSKISVYSPRFYSDRSQSSLSRRPGPLAYYNGLVSQGKLTHDPYQEKVVFELDKLLGRLERYEKDMEEYHANLAKWEENRENERRRLLMEEADAKQRGVSKTVNKRRSFFSRWITR